MSKNDWNASLDAIRQRVRKTLAEDVMLPYVYAYPPKAAYRPLLSGEQPLRDWSSFRGDLNIYVHIPYCEMKCSFCNLFAQTGYSSAQLDRYLEALLSELELVRSHMNRPSIRVASVYLGGGTPTVLTANHLETLTDRLRRDFRFAQGAELSIEAAPNSLDREKLKTLRNLGFDRISIGIQSFDDAELTSMHRKHDGQLGRDTVEAAVETGFANVNVDLIYGLPGQTLSTWLSSLKTARSLGAATMTLYPLMIRKGTLFGKRYVHSDSPFHGDREKFRYYDAACEYLLGGDFKQETFVTFRRGNGGCQHEFNEFLGIPTIGLGAGARSYAPSIHYANDDYLSRPGVGPTLSSYLTSLEKPAQLPARCGVRLNPDERARRFLLLALLHQGVDCLAYRRRFGEDAEERFGAVLAALHEEGCLQTNGRLMELTPIGKRASGLVGHLLTSGSVQERSRPYYALPTAPGKTPLPWQEK